MKQRKKQVLSFCIVLAFGLLAIGSKVNKIHYGAFNYNNNIEDRNDTLNYLVKNDGTKIYGKEIEWNSGMFIKDNIKIDDQKFKMSEIIGFHFGNTYKGRKGNVYIKRIVHGKINVYVQFTNVISTSKDSNGFLHTSNYTRTDQYAQIGELGKMLPLASKKEIKALVKDCPLAYQMIDMSNSAIRKAIKHNPNYLNSIFDVYNNGCKE